MGRDAVSGGFRWARSRSRSPRIGQAPPAVGRRAQERSQDREIGRRRGPFKPKCQSRPLPSQKPPRSEQLPANRWLPSRPPNTGLALLDLQGAAGHSGSSTGQIKAFGETRVQPGIPRNRGKLSGRGHRSASLAGRGALQADRPLTGQNLQADCRIMQVSKVDPVETGPPCLLAPSPGLNAGHGGRHRRSQTRPRRRW